jgi:hypothetical protein
MVTVSQIVSMHGRSARGKNIISLNNEGSQAFHPSSLITVGVAQK